MPFIHIKSLPFEKPIDIPTAVTNISNDFLRRNGVAIEHITVTWEFMYPGHYAVAGVVAEHQPTATHPVLVDLLAPDFNSQDQVIKMLQAAADSISKHVNIPIGNIFINFHQAHAGMVFDAGEVVQW